MEGRVGGWRQDILAQGRKRGLVGRVSVDAAAGAAGAPAEDIAAAFKKVTVPTGTVGLGGVPVDEGGVGGVQDAGGEAGG